MDSAQHVQEEKNFNLLPQAHMSAQDLLLYGST